MRPPILEVLRSLKKDHYLLIVSNEDPSCRGVFRQVGAPVRVAAEEMRAQSLQRIREALAAAEGVTTFANKEQQLTSAQERKYLQVSVSPRPDGGLELTPMIRESGGWVGAKDDRIQVPPEISEEGFAEALDEAFDGSIGTRRK